jgi:hypothetical protein
MQNEPTQATPVILTLNEEDNIGRTLQSLSWARRGRQLVEARFDWTRIATEMIAVYHWLVHGGDRPPCVSTVD